MNIEEVATNEGRSRALMEIVSRTIVVLEIFVCYSTWWVVRDEDPSCFSSVPASSGKSLSIISCGRDMFPKYSRIRNSWMGNCLLSHVTMTCGFVRAVISHRFQRSLFSRSKRGQQRRRCGCWVSISDEDLETIEWRPGHDSSRILFTLFPWVICAILWKVRF